MSGFFSGPPQVAGYLTDNLVLIEQRVQTELLQQLVGPQEDTSLQQLRNDEAPVLGQSVPIPTA